MVDRCGCPLYSSDPDDADLVMFLGPDERGVALEVIGVELEGDVILVIHAMRLRRSYRADYARVMACQGR